jgi:hypothetical protein
MLADFHIFGICAPPGHPKLVEIEADIIHAEGAVADAVAALAGRGGEERHHAIANPERLDGASHFSDLAGTLAAENVRHVETEITGNTATHVEVEMIESDRFQVDQDIVRPGFGRRDILIDEFFRATMLVDDNRLHNLLSPVQAATSVALWRSVGVSRIIAAISGFAPASIGAR